MAYAISSHFQERAYGVSDQILVWACLFNNAEAVAHFYTRCNPIVVLRETGKWKKAVPGFTKNDLQILAEYHEAYKQRALIEQNIGEQGLIRRTSKI